MYHMYTRTFCNTLRGVPPVVTASTQHGKGTVCRWLCVLLGRAGGVSMHHMYTHTVWDTLRGAPYLLSQVQPSMARELFAAGFVSCWAELEEPMREALVRSLEAALASPSIPPEIVTTLLNLAEFMEHNEKKLPLDTRQVWLLSAQSVLCRGWCRAVSCRTLGAVAEKCHALAKALHYKEHARQDTFHRLAECSLPTCRTLGALAEKCHAFAKALHYKEHA